MAVAYFKKSGALVCVSTGTNTVQEMAPDGELAYAAVVDEDVQHALFYYDVADGKVKQKQNFNVRVFQGKIDNIPPGTKATVEDMVCVIDDGILEITGNISGARTKVLLTHVKYNPTVLEVTV